MTKTESTFDFSQNSKKSKEDIYNSKDGVTKRLLEKYKPSKCLKIIDGGNEMPEERRAA